MGCLVGGGSGSCGCIAVVVIIGSFIVIVLVGIFLGAIQLQMIGEKGSSSLTGIGFSLWQGACQVCLWLGAVVEEVCCVVGGVGR